MTRVLGIDPGIRNVGLAIMEKSDSEIICIKLALIASKSDKKKSATENDIATYNSIIETVKNTIAENKVDTVAIEQYSPFVARNSGAKIATVFGILYALCKQMSLRIHVFRPLDLHKYFRTNGEKIVLMNILCKAFPNLENSLNALPRKLREHVSDAAGYAAMTLLQEEKK